MSVSLQSTVLKSHVITAKVAILLAVLRHLSVTYLTTFIQICYSRISIRKVLYALSKHTNNMGKRVTRGRRGKVSPALFRKMEKSALVFEKTS